MFELAAAFNVAFVAVEYSRSYTSALSESVFKFHSIITNAFKPCRDLLCESVTLENLPNHVIDGKSTLVQSERLKISLETLQKELNEKEKSLTNEVKDLCISNIFSTLSLWGLLFSILMLILSGLQNDYNLFVLYLMTLSSLMSLGFMIFGWSKGENGKYKLYLSLSRTLRLFFISTALIITISIILLNTLRDFSSILTYVTPLAAIIPLLNFIAYFYIIRSKSRSITTKIKSEAEALEKRHTTEDIKAEIKQLVFLEKLNLKL